MMRRISAELLRRVSDFPGKLETEFVGYKKRSREGAGSLRDEASGGSKEERVN